MPAGRASVKQPYHHVDRCPHSEFSAPLLRHQALTDNWAGKENFPNSQTGYLAFVKIPWTTSFIGI